MEYLYMVLMLINFPTALTFDDSYQYCKILKNITSCYDNGNMLNYHLACIAGKDTIVIISPRESNCNINFLDTIKLNTEYLFFLHFQKNANNLQSTSLYVEMRNYYGKYLEVDLGLFNSREEFQCKEQLFIYWINCISSSSTTNFLHYFTPDICNGKIREQVVIKE